MNRRGFLGALATLAVAHTFDPERLLWVPGAKTFFIPETVRVGGVGNTFLTIDMITREALRVLENNLKLMSHINREYDDKWLSADVRFSGSRSRR